MIEAAEMVGPAIDMAAGMHKLAKYYYYPCWHEPGAIFDLFINKAKWDALPPSLKAGIEATALWLNYRMLSNDVARNSAALTTLVKKHGVQLRRFPDKVLKELARLSEQILRERASKDKLTNEVLNSIMRFRKEASGWSAVTLQPYLAARAGVS
jgi:TRAP-type mannitol/chloroaromatic compound transport system substrate-binding protein